MTEYSFPIPEVAMNVDGWSSVTKGIGNGILDQGGFPYRLTSLSNVDNTGVIKCPTNATTRDQYGQAILEGFYHRYDADIKLSFPAVTSRTTYYVVLQYDPSNAATPVSLKVLTSLDYSQGKNYLHLYNVTRNANELLTNATVRMVRPRVSPLIAVSSYADLPQAQKTLWGTLAVVHNGRTGNNAQLYIAMTGDDEESVNGWFWKKIYDPNDNGFTWTEVADTGTYKWPGSGFRRSLGRRGKERKLRGRVALVSGNKFQDGGDYAILSGAIDPADAPAAVQRFAVSTGGSGAGGQSNIEVSSTGDVTAKITGSTYWVSLDGVSWEAK